MNKNAIKKFAVEARQKLIASVTDKAGMLGITAEGVSALITKRNDFEVYQTAAGTEVTLNKKQCEQRRRLVEQIETKGFGEVVEEVTYTWFNRICAIRFMEVNDYLPSRVRALSSEKEGKNEPDLVTQAPDVDLDLTDAEKEFVIESKMSGKLDELFAMLFVKQCNKLHEVLPELFEETSDYTEMLLSISFTNKDDVIRMLIDEVPEEDFNITTTDENGNVPGQVEIIGWLYQYYNTELKDDTFAKLKKNIKITKERIPAATQLFTPDWIVRYMVENSVGRLWIEHLRAVDPSVDEKKTAEEFGWKYYLPEAKQEESVNQQLATIREDYKNMTPEDIACIDPCMGSGHILVTMFDVLMDIYKSAGYSERDAALLIVQRNIYGLDIDKRAYQLAYFAVMMKGRQCNRKFLKYREVYLEPMIHAIEDSNGVNRAHIKFFGAGLSDDEKSNAISQITGLLDEFVDAREYGSIIDVTNFDWDLLRAFISRYSIEGQISFETIGIEETKSKLYSLINQGRVLAKKYSAVVTNPPYMGGANMTPKLSSYIKAHYDAGKSDFATVFIQKCIYMGDKKARVSLVTPQSWMFLIAFDELRRQILSTVSISSLLHLGTGAFDAGFGTSAYVINKNWKPNVKGVFFDLRPGKDNDEKINMINRNENRFVISSSVMNQLPNSVIAYWCSKEFRDVFTRQEPIKSIYSLECGIKNGNNDQFLRLWHEVSYEQINVSTDRDESLANMENGKKWFKCNKGGGYRKWYGNYEYVINLESDARDIKRTVPSSTYRLRKKDNYFRETITWPLVSGNKFGCRFMDIDTLPDVNANIILIKGSKEYALMGYMNSKVFDQILDMLNPSLAFPIDTIGNAPYSSFNSEHLVELVKENIELSREDWNSFETNWGFRKHPLIPDTLNDNSLISDIYKKWTTLCEERFYRVKNIEEEINDIFINEYHLNNEMTAEVQEDDICIQKASLDRDIRSLISFAVGCMFGRYSLTSPGLAYAGGKWSDESYNLFIPNKDNVIPITDDEYFSDDIVGCFCEWIKLVYGEKSLEKNIDFIAKALGNKGDSSREIIRNYFMKDFIRDHIKMYQKCPIYWLFDSGKEDGFKALIYMHRYTPDTVGIIRTDYLHKTQKAIEQAMQRAHYTSENASSAADKKKAVQQITKYTKQLAQMKTYDEAMAHIANQRIEIDLDDGVKVNYEKFQGVEVVQEGKKALKIDLLAKIK